MDVKQIGLFQYYEKSTGRAGLYDDVKGRLVHGGSGSKGHRKLARPLARNKWTHLVLKSKKAKGSLSFLSPKNKSYIEALVRAKAQRFHVKIGEMVNVGNHLHIKFKMLDRQNFQKFLKAITCLISRHVTGARRGKSFGRFWDGLAFTRVLKSSFEELHLRGYFEANRREATQSQRAREEYLSRFNAWVKSLRSDPMVNSS